MHHNPMDTYEEHPSRLGFAIVAIIGLSICAFMLFGVFSRQPWTGEEYGMLAMAAFMGILGAVMTVAAVRPPVHLKLDEEGASFKSPPVKVRWSDVREIHVSKEGMNTVVEVVVDDLDKYLLPLSDSQRKKLKYEITSKALRFSFVGSGRTAELRKEMEARRQTVTSFGGQREREPIVAEESPQETFVFNARFLGQLVPDRLYRVYYRPGAFYLVRIGGQGNMEMVGAQFGLVGLLIALWAKRGATTPEDVAQMDETHPEQLLSAHRHNFSIAAGDVVEASIEAKAKFQGHGMHVGRMSLVLANRKKFSFQFEDMRHMRTAVVNLPPVLGAVLKTKVRWDEENGQYVRCEEFG